MYTVVIEYKLKQTLDLRKLELTYETYIRADEIDLIHEICNHARVDEDDIVKDSVRSYPKSNSNALKESKKLMKQKDEDFKKWAAQLQADRDQKRGIKTGNSNEESEGVKGIKNFMTGGNDEKHRHEEEIALKRRQLELEEKKNRQKRADELRAQGKTTQAFFVEHGMAVGIGVFVVLMGIFVGYQILNSKSNAKDGAEINLRLEGLEDQIKLAIKEGNQDKALELTNQLVHPLHEKWEDQSKYDTWNGYPFYDEWWTERRKEYKDKILSMQGSKNASTKEEANKSTDDNSDYKDSPTDSEIQSNSDTEKSNVVYFKIQDPDGYSNLRSTPNGDVIKKVFDTEVFEIIGSEGKFKKVRLADGTEGFIHESRLVNAD